MRFSIIAAPVFSILAFSGAAKAHPQALLKLLEKTDKVAICKTDSPRLSLVNFYLHKVTSMIVAEFQNTQQQTPTEQFYSLNMEENKKLVILTTDKEIAATDFDLYFKNTNNKFTIHFTVDAVRNAEAKNFTSTLHFQDGASINLTCQRAD